MFLWLFIASVPAATFNAFLTDRCCESTSWVPRGEGLFFTRPGLEALVS